MSIVRMQGPENCGGFSHGGHSYEADEDGVIEIPSAIIDHAKQHGFSLVTEPRVLRPLAKDEAKAVTKPTPMKLTKSEDAGEAKAGGGK